ncbi:MAG: DUF3823 domain-containing protein [Bacteroidales bacterium]|nr:DUF3823 domain-containing protein [Bacteroidales bacterium]
MKKILVLLSLLILATSCDWFVFDNQDSYNAQVEGRFIDSATGDPVQFAFYNTSKISIIEEGWDKEEAEEWYVKCNGTYRNKLVFAGKYRLDTKDQCFYPVVIPFTLEKGKNTVDFTVTPYARILNPKITYEGTKLVARFTVQVADAAQTSKVDVALFGFTDRYVSESNNNFIFDKKNKNYQPEGKIEKVKLTNGQADVVLAINTEIPSGNQFVYKRDHYLRIGAVATGNANSSKRYNYSPVYKVSSDFSKIEEVTLWDEDQLY